MSEHNNIKRYYIDLLTPLVRNKLCILAPGPVADTRPWVRQLMKLGASDILVLDQGMLKGNRHASKHVQYLSIGKRAPDILTAARRYEEKLRNPNNEILDQVNQFDPDQNAQFILTSLFPRIPLGERNLLGGRSEQWITIEDKVAVNKLWNMASIPHIPYKVVETNTEMMVSAASIIDQGSGTVWAGDSKEGFNAAALYVRWIKRTSKKHPAVKFFQNHCDRIRIMPFLEGIPCSIHGMVFENYVAVFRPMEMIVLRRFNSTKFLYAGNSTFWDTKPEDRKSMQQSARRIGELLREKVDYRGGFSLDGILTEEGFRPTEINTRFADGFWTLVHSMNDFPLAFLDLALRSGIKLDYRPIDLEKLIIKSADNQRSVSAWCVSDKLCNSISEIMFCYDENVARVVNNEADSDGYMQIIPSQAGSFIRIILKNHRLILGKSVAPLIVGAFNIADQLYNTGFGRLTCASDEK